ncbi:MAG: type III polyketide synthase [Planctomycetaceae bacterium]|nr:type III polyketide synthase [Planctomycetaceae bacterium]
MPFEILGTGLALPPHSIAQEEAAEFAGTCLAGETHDVGRSAALVSALYRRSGVQTRHSVVLDSSTSAGSATQTFYPSSEERTELGPGTAERMQRYEADAPKLAAAAAADALEQSGVSPESVTHLVTVSCSGFSAPGVDLYLIHELQLAPTVARTHVGFMGCHGALNGLRTAAAFAASDPQAVVLVCAVELCTLHHQYGWDPQRIVANSLFADGAAAVVGRAARPVEGAGDDVCRPEAANVSTSFILGHASQIVPNTHHMMTWRIGDHGFRMTLSPEVPDVITRSLAGVLNTFLSRFGMTMSDVPSWAIHPGGPRILNAVGEVAGLTSDQLEPSRRVLARCGNMSSPTVLFILDELRRRGAPHPTVMLAFGPGLNIEMALISANALVNSDRSE